LEREKGKRPIIPLVERMEIVESIKYVDCVVPQENYDKMEAWNNLHFNKMFVGDDWRGSPKWTQLEKDFAALGVQICYFPYTKQTSSTRIRQILDAYEEKNLLNGGKE
jgi:glycerol-3-phosphate cytidylyltransferase